MVLHCQISMELAFGYIKINYAKKSTPVTEMKKFFFKGTLKQDQGSKAPSGHTSFYLCLPFYQVYLSILSFAPCPFLPSLPI